MPGARARPKGMVVKPKKDWILSSMVGSFSGRVPLAAVMAVVTAAMLVRVQAAEDRAQRQGRSAASEAAMRSMVGFGGRAGQLHRVPAR